MVALGTPELLKKEIAGDVVHIGLMPDFDKESIVTILTPQNFVRSISHDESGIRVYVRNGHEDLLHIIRLLDNAAIAISRLGVTQPSLDDVFLKQTGHSLESVTQK